MLLKINNPDFFFLSLYFQTNSPDGEQRDVTDERGKILQGELAHMLHMKENSALTV